MGDYDDGYAAGFQAHVDLMSAAASTLSTEAHHKIMRMAGSAHACEVTDCVLSQEEHHRLAYGILAENRDLRRRVEELEHGPKEASHGDSSE